MPATSKYKNGNNPFAVLFLTPLPLRFINATA